MKPEFVLCRILSFFDTIVDIECMDARNSV